MTKVQDEDGNEYLEVGIPGVLTLYWPLNQEEDEDNYWDEEEAGCTYSEYVRNGYRIR